MEKIIKPQTRRYSSLLYSEYMLRSSDPTEFQTSVEYLIILIILAQHNHGQTVNSLVGA